MGPFGKYGDPISEHGFAEMALFLGLGLLLAGQKKHESLKKQQSYETPNGSNKCMLFVLYPREVAHHKKNFFFKMGLLTFTQPGPSFGFFGK